MEGLEILDCTLRDGSYPISYQFTAEDTAMIAAGLQDAGFRMIEIGHGMGLGASRKEFGIAAASDEEYLEAASSVLSRADFGMFFIPGIANQHHLELAKKYKMGFIRIGTNITETEQAEEYIKIAKNLGMEVSANLMKIYALPIPEVIKRAEQLYKWGADIICVVDSAGGMLPEEVTQYIAHLKNSIGARIGFHGHNNLQMAIANSLAAIHAGATVIDSSLRGIGRSSGNAQTEVLLMILDRMGYNLGIDAFKTMDLAEKIIGPMAQGRGIDPIELVSGYAMFHSSFLKIIQRVSMETGVDPRQLIIQVSKIEKVRVNEELTREVAKKILHEKACDTHIRNQYPSCPEWKPFLSDEKLGTKELVRNIALEIGAISKKTGRCSIFTIARSSLNKNLGPTFPFIRANSIAVIGNAEVESADQAIEVASAVDGLVDFIFVDGEVNSIDGENEIHLVGQIVKKSKLLTYRDRYAQLDAAEAYINQMVTKLHKTRIAVCGLSSFGLNIALRLLERGAIIRIWDEKKESAERSVRLLSDWMEFKNRAGNSNIACLEPGNSDIDVLLGACARKPVVDGKLVDSVHDGGIIFDAAVGALKKEGIERAVCRGLRIYRLDMRAGLSAQITLVLETQDLVSKVMGQGEIAGISVVAGGIVGKRGTIVIDSLAEPTRVIGVGDGQGHLLSQSEMTAYRENIDRVKAELRRMRLP